MKSSPSQAAAISPKRGSTARWATKSFVFSSGKEPRKHHPFGPDENLPVGLDLVVSVSGVGVAEKRKNAEQLSEWKRDQSSSMDGAELSYKARNMPWLSEIELTSNIRRNFGLSNWLRENVAVPVRRRHTEAAPHTYTVQPFFPSVGCLANECS